MTKTPMGIAANNLAESDDESFLGDRLRADCDQAGVQVAEEGNVLRRPALLILMPDPGHCLASTHCRRSRPADFGFVED